MYLRFVTALLILVVAACQPPAAYQLEFCADFDQVENCEPDRNTFPVGQRLELMLTATDSLPMPLVTGTLYDVSTDKREYLISQDFTITPGQNRVHHYLPFDKKRVVSQYEVEFTDQDGRVLVNRSLVIVPE